MKYFFSFLGLLIGIGIGFGIAYVAPWRLWSRGAGVVQREESPHKHLTHVGVIMDGNRRWASQHGLEPWMGHRQGIEPLKVMVRLCIERAIPYLTVYAFSLENFKRSTQELHYLFDILAGEVAQSTFDELIKNGVRVRFVGDRSRFPDQLRETISRLEQSSALGDKLMLNILFCYGGQQEIVAAARQLAEQVERGTLRAVDITADLFARTLWLGDIPVPDLVIRTGGDGRLSNFLTYHVAYAEIRCIPTLWPDMDRTKFEHILNEFGTARRKFGA